MRSLESLDQIEDQFIKKFLFLNSLDENKIRNLSVFA